MNLPPQLAELFRRERGCEPAVVVRSLYDLHGGLGSTYLAADREALMVHSQPGAGEPHHSFLPWSEIGNILVRDDSVFAFLEFTMPSGPVRLQFAAWDKPRLDALVDLWNERHQAKTPSVSVPQTMVPKPERAIQLMATPPLSPLVAFCASIHALIECDGQVDPAELGYLAKHVPDGTAIRHGHEFLKEYGPETLCTHLREVLNESQRRCLMANLIGVAMVDGWVRSNELEALDRFQSALDVADPEREAMFDLLMTKNNLAVFAPTEQSAARLPEIDGLTPLMAYCASLRAMMESDADPSPAEERLLLQAVPYPENIQLGDDYLHAYGLDYLLSRLGAVLDAPQRRCLLANLIAVAMEDGIIHSSEQQVLDRFRRALGVPQEEYDVVYKGLLVKDNLAIFASLP